MRKIKLPDTIKMVITDFDGVVTDNCVYIGEDFSMSRKLNFKDVMGFSLLKKSGIKMAIISGEKIPLLICLHANSSLKKFIRT